MDPHIIDNILKYVSLSHTAPRDLPALACINKVTFELSKKYKYSKSGNYIYRSVYNGDHEMLEYLRRKGVAYYDAEICAQIARGNYNIADVIEKIDPTDTKAWDTALNFATRAKQKSLVVEFVERGAKNFSTALNIAKRYRNKDIFEYLREQQTQSRQPIRYIFTPRHYVLNLIGEMYPEMDNLEKEQLADRCINLLPVNSRVNYRYLIERTYLGM